MPDFIASALATDGLGWIALAALVAGIVRGFAGFGTAMIFLPVAAQFLHPAQAMMVLIGMDILGPLPIVSGAIRDAQWPDLRRLLFGMVLALPFGLSLLLSVDPQVFRYTLAAISIGMVLCLVLGLRYTGQMRPGVVFGTGAVGGFLGGVAGLPGPPVILLYMAGVFPSKVIRANTMLFLLVFDVALVLAFAAFGMLQVSFLVIGVLMAIPAAVGSVVGGFLFRPGYEKLYRAVAYAIIVFSALTGLPIWDKV